MPLAHSTIPILPASPPLPEDGPDLPESLFVVPDVLVRFDAARRTFQVDVRIAAPEGLDPGAFHGRFHADETRVITGVVVPLVG